MSSEQQNKVSPPQSKIPVPKTYSLRPLTQTQSIDNLTTLQENHANKSPTLDRRITRNGSVSRLPTYRSANVTSRPSMSRSVSHISNSNSDLSSIASTCYQTTLTSNKWKSSGKIYKPKDSQVQCQRFQKNHNQSHNQTKPTANFKIYNKFSPYYDHESLESHAGDGHNTRRKNSECDTNSSISSAEESVKSGRKGGNNQLRQNGNQFQKRQLTNEEARLYRTQSVPEHIQQQINCDNKVLDQKSIEMIKKRILESIDNADEDQVDIDEEAEGNGGGGFELCRQVENKLLRIVIRHLREKLTQSKSDLDKLTQQSNSSKQMSEAFQKSLSAITIRAQHLTQQLETKQTELDDISNQLKDKNLEFEDLNRKYQLLDGEYRRLQTNINNNINGREGKDKTSGSRTESAMSVVSNGDSPEDTKHTKETKESYARLKFRRTSSWLRGSTLSKAFKRRKKFRIFSANSVSDQTSEHKSSTSNSIFHLKDLIRQKELTITDLRLESLATNDKMDKLEDQLKSSKEETDHLKKNKDFLEKIVKMKIIE